MDPHQFHSVLQLKDLSWSSIEHYVESIEPAKLYTGILASVMFGGIFFNLVVMVARYSVVPPRRFQHFCVVLFGLYQCLSGLTMTCYGGWGADAFAGKDESLNQ